jgi:hypothetical protein
MMDVTFSKQWIHFLRSLRWPPTSNMLFHISRHAGGLSEHAHVLDAELAHGESCLVDTGRLRSRSQDVGLDGDVVGVCYSLDLVEEAKTSA